MNADERKEKLLRYGELMARKTRGQSREGEPEEMERIRSELSLSPEQIVNEVENLIHKSY